MPENQDSPPCACESDMTIPDWNEQVEALRASGSRVIAPNGLPIVCIKHDGTLLEHEHAEHPDYKFPVMIDYVGDDPVDQWIDGDGNVFPMSPEEAEAMKHQSHALIYADGCVAITLYECCYAMWYLRKGEFGGGSLWSKDWKMSEESMAKCAQMKR